MSSMFVLKKYVTVNIKATDITCPKMGKAKAFDV